MRRLTVLGVTVLVMAALAGRDAPASGAPLVVVSIRPIHSLVAGVMAGVGEPFLLVRGGGSPHAYALRPSEAKALQDADLVVWVGESMETFLTDSLATLAPDARVLELMEAPGVTVLEVREDAVWEVHGHEDGDDHDGDDHDGDDHDDTHDHEGIDGHIWLDPANAKAVVAAVVAELNVLDPANAAAYRANGQRVIAQIDDLSGRIGERVAPVADRPYIVFHDAYQYFQRRFGTNAVGSVTVSPEKQPGAARIAEIRGRLSNEGVVCVFREPQFSPRVIATLVEGTDVRVGVLDPLGTDIDAGPDHYAKLMTALADGLVDCLAD